MQATESAQAYLKAWNDHDSRAIVATFADGGTYTDPVAGELPAAALGDYAAGLFEAFPDLGFEEAGVTVAGDTVVAQWIMRGENTGPLQGGPPTGGTIALPGVDVITVGDGGIRSVRGYFDQKTFVEQLGLQVIVQPHAMGPVSFGNSVRAATGSKAAPGSLSLTWIEVDSDEDREKVRQLTRNTIMELLGMPGFIATSTGFAGRRGVTVTAWENEAAGIAGANCEAHRKAMTEVFENGLGTAAFTSFWQPSRFNRLMVRCAGCGKMADVARGAGTCGCGAALPEAPSYW